MPFWVGLILSCAAAYLLGSLSGGIIISKLAKGPDLHTVGSKSTGASNVQRTMGWKYGLMTFFFDAGKGILSCLIAQLITGSHMVSLLAGLFCVIGHNWPVFFRFRGGKGVVTTNLAITVYNPLWGVIANLLGAAIVAATQYLCLAGPAVPAVYAVIMFIRGDAEAGVLSLVLTALAVYCHSKSIFGMFNGTTSRTDVIGALKKKLSRK